jgi:hypothetical protein
MACDKGGAASERIAVVAAPLTVVSPIVPVGLANPEKDPGNTDHEGAADTVPVPVCDRNNWLVVVLPARADNTLAALPYQMSPSTAVLGIVVVDHTGCVAVPPDRRYEPAATSDNFARVVAALAVSKSPIV